MKLGIISVGLNCLEYSKKTLDSIVTKHDYEIIFINNGSTDGTYEWLESRKDIISYQNPVNSGLSACWNLGIKRAIEDGCDLMVVINNDIVLAPNTIDNMVKRYEKGDVVMVTGVNDQSIDEHMTKGSFKNYEEEDINNHPDFSCFLIGKDTIDKVGFFDENFIMAYFEDSDYAARMAMGGYDSTSIISASYYHFGSKTVKENPLLANLIHDAFRHNKEYFIKKWGTENVGDVPKMRKVYWKHPFNDTNRDIKNIEMFFSLASLNA